MEKHLRNIYKDIYSYENLHQAYINERRNRRFRGDVLVFTNDLEENLITIQNELIWQTYKVGRYREFFVYEPKKRLIMALPLRDRVVQWAIYQVLNHEFQKAYIKDTYACIAGRGTHEAVKRLHYWLHKVDRKPQKFYYLKMDVAKFFYRVDHAILEEILGRKIKDERVMWLLSTIINSESTYFGLPLGCSLEDTAVRLPDKGMPIGNLTSQMFANIYLNELDQFVKRELKVKYYIRYMDDAIILSDNKDLLHEYKNMIGEFLETKLRLNLNSKTAIRPVSLGIEFVGYKLWPTHIKLKKASSLKMKRKLKYVQKAYARGEMDFDKANSTVQSYLGILQHCNSYTLKNKIFENFVLKKEEH